MTPQQRYKEIIEEVAKKLNLPADVVEKTHKAYWRFVRESIAKLPLKEDLSEEEFNQLRTSINIPSLGKFHCDYDRYLRVRKKFEYIKKIKEYGRNDNHED